VTEIAPGWYRDPVDSTIQRYWDGEAYLGDPLPADVTPPPGPPPDVGGAGGAGSPGSTRDPAGWPAASPAATSPAATGSAPGDLVPTGPASVGTGPVTRGAGPVETGSARAGPAETTPTAADTAPTGTGTAAGTGAGTPPGALLPPGPTPSAGWPEYPTLVLPPPKPHGYPLAGFGARFIARMIDTLALLALNILVNGWFVYQWLQIYRPFWGEARRRWNAGESTQGLEPPQEGSTFMIIILILAALLWFAYEVPSLANTGQTPGKRLTGIKVMRLESAEELGFRRSIRRWNTIGLPTLLWTCFGLGFMLQLVDCLWAAVDRPLRQALHDKSALTVVVFVGTSTSDRGGPA